MKSNDGKSKGAEYFSLSKEDRLDFELEEQEKKEKDSAIQKVFEKVNKKDTK